MSQNEVMSRGQALALAGEQIELALSEFTDRPPQRWPAWARELVQARRVLSDLHKEVSPNNLAAVGCGCVYREPRAVEVSRKRG